MHKFLILLVVCFIGTATLIHAQVPKAISVPYQFDPNTAFSSPDALPCNFAGTFTLGTFTGQSNDTALDTIYLCEGDQIQIDHNGDSDLSGDPVPATPPGVAWAFYTCPPTVMGDSYQALLANESCLLLSPTGAPIFAFGQANGDITFINNGNLQNTYNGGLPVLFHFAPITVDNFDPLQTYENNIVGAPPGPCLNANTAVAFEVVYLNAIEESGVSTNFGNDCLGKFRISGGFPQWNALARYTIDISLASNPSVKALIHNNINQIGNNTDVIFSVTQPGVYNVTIEDGKSCGHTFQITMNVCNSNDNVVVTLPDTIAPPNSQICIPVIVNNFQVVGASFSVEWDPTILSYNGVQNPNSEIGNIFNASNLNTQVTTQGKLGLVIYNQEVFGQVINIPNGGTLVEICFTVVGPLDSCSGLDVTNNPTFINIENQTGTTVAVTAVQGQACVGFLPLDMAIEIIDTSCAGMATLKVTATGGVAPYEVIAARVGGPTYSGPILSPGGSFTQANVPSGVYEICVIDVDSVYVCDTLTLEFPIVSVVLEKTKRPTCFGYTDGIVTAVISLDSVPVPNPGPNFTFTWSPVNPDGNVAVFDSAAVGNYSVTVTETNSGCTATDFVTLDQPLPVIIPLANIVVTPTTCTGIFDGGITLLAQGGTPFPGTEYLYNWEYTCNTSGAPIFEANFQDSLSVLTGLQNCTYYVTATDANGCTVTHQIDVPTLRIVEIQLTNPITPIETNCLGDSTASICVQVVETPASPNPNYSFFWQAVGYPQTTPSATESCYEDLPAGSYFVVAIDAAGCVDSATYVVESPDSLFLQATITQPNCTFQNNGAITVQGFGGTNTGPNSYTYIWTPAATGPTISGLSPGDYTVTVSDLRGCEDSMTYTLTLPPPPVIDNVDSISVKCGSDGSLTVTSPTAVSYNWVTIGGQFVGNTSTINNLQGDTFIVTIMDNQGCTTVDTFSLAPVTPMSFSDTSFTEPACFGYSDGIISVGVINGNPPYNYTWSVDSTGQGTPTLFGIPAGDYIVTVTDAEGCSLVDTFTLGQPPEIIISYMADPTPASCFGVCDASLTAIAQYATTPPTSTDFNFVWSDGGTDSVRTDLCADTVNLIVIDGNNCFSTDTVIIPGPPEVSYSSLTTVPATCNGGSDGQAIVEGAGGNGAPFTYEWSNGDNGAIADSLTAQEWEVTITDKDGCTAEYTAEVTQPEPIVVTQNPDASEDVKCFGGSDGKLGVFATGGNPGGYTYSWMDQDSMIVGSMQNEGDLPAGIYSVTVTDPEGCTGVLQNLVIIDPPPVQGSYLPYEPLLCFGDETTLYIDTIYGGSGGPYQFSLDYGVTLDAGFPVSMGGGIHYITYFDRFDCEFTDTLDVPEPDEIIVNFTPATWEIELGDTLYQLKPNIMNAVIDTFTWFPAESLRSPSDLSPYVHTYENETYTLTVYDANGCSGSGSITIEVDPNRNVYVPNVFKPGNVRGENDYFYPMVGLGVEHVNYMRIYDRWGGLMFELNDFYPNPDNLAQGWNGRYNGDYVNPGVFVYVIEVRFLDGKVLTYRGDVTVVR